MTAWEPSEELLEQLRKGASVYVEGKLTHGTWTAEDGTPRCGLNLSAWRVDVHGAIGKQAPRREMAPTDLSTESSTHSPVPAWANGSPRFMTLSWNQ